MFGLFTSPSVSDPQLGELVRTRGHWRGKLRLHADLTVPLVLAGGRAKPDPAALAMAHALPGQQGDRQAIIEQALFDHYVPYADAVAAGESEDGHALPQMRASHEVWAHVSLTHIAIVPLGAIMTTEFAYAVDWDEEHLLGARFQSNEFIELCGSTTAP